MAVVGAIQIINSPEVGAFQFVAPAGGRSRFVFGFGLQMGKMGQMGS